jgi:hypothetical protein
VLHGLAFASFRLPRPPENPMPYRSLILAIELAVALAITIGGAYAADEAKYPNLKGQWVRFGGPPHDFAGLPGQLSFDQTKPWGPGQQAPLTPEYQAILDASWPTRRMAASAITRKPCVSLPACRT